VLGNTREIPKLVKARYVNKIFVAIPSVTPKARRRILLTCKRTGLKIKLLPGVGELLNGKVKVESLRDFRIDDLLGRKPVKLDTASIEEYLRDKTVMVTGAGGSIGSELCRRIAHFSPRKLVLFERSEYNLYQIQMNLMELFPNVDIAAVIGDVMNRHNVERCLSRYMPDVIFHAAAYKHVPLMEMNPAEALRNNVQGTRTVAEMARKFGVGKFVMVSTDKAVRSTNIMGVSKRIAELICESLSEDGKTQFVTVRFGNVLNSVGSVIPLFKRQIEKGGPLTVTHPEIYRYFMTIPESVQLILQAGAMGKGGEIFILDMGEPVKIVDLARDMITLSGLVPDKDIKIVYTGLRPGEKLYEELLTEGEEVKSTLHEKIKVAGGEEVDGAALFAWLDEMFLELQQKGFTLETVAKIKNMVPEFQPENCGQAPKKSLRNLSCELTRKPLSEQQ
jgi:FlaA1/EpsC-like NDP-sugar epimerase